MGQDLEPIAGGCDSKMVDVLDQAYSTLRHELVNSVNSLKITLQVLAAQFDSFNPEKKAEYFERALAQVIRQQEFIERLRAYSAAAPEIAPVSLLVFWSDFLIPVSESLSRRNIGFSQDCAAGACMISADKSMLARVLDYLVDNAVDALQEVENPKIVLVAENIEGRIRISVTDNGPGIKQEHYNKVFIPLFTTREDRPGIGLSMAQRLVAKMGGEIVVRSARKHGTTIEVWLNSLDA